MSKRSNVKSCEKLLKNSVSDSLGIGSPLDLSGIDQALRAGCRLHTFRSGGGLRVVRLENKGKLKGYGEHPDIREALVHTCEDYIAGGRPYKEVYGKIYPNYLTGSSSPSCELDIWVLHGHTFDAWMEGNDVVVELKGTAETKHPDGLDERVRAEGKVIWKNRGFTYRSSNSRFPNGEASISTEVIGYPDDIPDKDVVREIMEERPNHVDAWSYHISKKATGDDLCTALNAAFKASEVETPDD
jgi:hypothetical protein